MQSNRPPDKSVEAVLAEFASKLATSSSPSPVAGIVQPSLCAICHWSSAERSDGFKRRVQGVLLLRDAVAVCPLMSTPKPRSLHDDIR